MVIVTTYEKCKFFYTRKEIVITLISIESQCEFIIKIENSFKKIRKRILLRYERLFFLIWMEHFIITSSMK